MSKCGVVRGLALGIWMAGCMQVAWATAYTWSGGASGTWDVSGNWTPAGVPGSNDTASVTNPCTLALNGDQAALGVSVGRTNDTGGYTINAATNTLVLGSNGFVVVGDASAGRTYTISPKITLTAPSALKLDYSGSGNRNHGINFNGAVTAGNNDLALVNGWASSLYVAGGITGSGSILVDAAASYGTTFLRYTNTVTGALWLQTVVSNGKTLVMDGNGVLAGSTNVLLTKSSYLELGSSSSSKADDGLVGSGNQGRIPNNARVSLRPGSITLVGQNSTLSSETVGDLMLGYGASSLTVQNGTSSTSIWQSAKLVRPTPGSVLNASSVNNNLGGAGRIMFADNGASLPHVGGTSSRSTDRPVIPFMVTRAKSTYNSRPDSFARYDATTGLTPLDVTNEFVVLTYADLVASNFPTVNTDGWDNVRIGFGVITNLDYSMHPLRLQNSTTTINSFLGDADTTNSIFGGSYFQFDFTGGTNLIVRSGLILVSGTGSGDKQATVQFTIPTITFGDAVTNSEGMIVYYGEGGPGRITMYSKLAGTCGATFYSNNGGDDMQIRGDNSGLTGTVTVASGPIRFYHVNGLGTGSNPVVVASGGTLKLDAAISGGRGFTAASLAGQGTVQRQNGGLTIGGDGSGAVDNRVRLVAGGTIAPGDTGIPGWLTFTSYSSVSLGGGTLAIDLFKPRNTWGGIDAAVSDSLVISGTPAVTLSGGTGTNGTTLVVGLQYAPQPGDAFKIVDVAGATATTGKFSNGDAVRASYGDKQYGFDILYNSSLAGGDGNDVVLRCTGSIPTGFMLIAE